jgi:hypothetical protein
MYKTTDHERLYLPQGLFEYVRPAWEERARPKVADMDLKTFGATVPQRPTITGAGDASDVPRYLYTLGFCVSVFSVPYSLCCSLLLFISISVFYVCLCVTHSLLSSHSLPFLLFPPFPSLPHPCKIISLESLIHPSPDYSIDRTYKLYYGGGQKRPDAQYARPIYSADGKLMANVPEANRKDVRNAVEAAHKAAPG